MSNFAKERTEGKVSMILVIGTGQWSKIYSFTQLPSLISGVILVK